MPKPLLIVFAIAGLQNLEFTSADTARLPLPQANVLPAKFVKFFFYTSTIY